MIGLVGLAMTHRLSSERGVTRNTHLRGRGREGHVGKNVYIIKPKPFVRSTNEIKEVYDVSSDHMMTSSYHVVIREKGLVRHR